MVMGSAPRSNPLPSFFFLPFLAEKVPLSYTSIDECYLQCSLQKTESLLTAVNATSFNNNKSLITKP